MADRGEISGDAEILCFVAPSSLRDDATRLLHCLLLRWMQSRFAGQPPNRAWMRAYACAVAALLACAAAERPQTAKERSTKERTKSITDREKVRHGLYTQDVQRHTASHGADRKHAHQVKFDGKGKRNKFQRKDRKLREDKKNAAHDRKARKHQRDRRYRLDL